MSQSTTIRVLIVDDHSIVRQGLATIINRDPEMTVIAQAEDGQQAIDRFREYQPDVTLMDLRMPQMGGVEAITAICAEFKSARRVGESPQTCYDRKRHLESIEAFLSRFPGVQRVMIDGIERPIARPQDPEQQKQNYIR